MGRLKEFKMFKLILFLVLNFVKSEAYLQDNNPYRHLVTLDPKSNYQLEWLVDWEKKSVHFNVTVNTNGYIGLGLAKKGKMDGADIVIGGVGKDGKPYFTDRHAIGNQLPVVDESQDWTLNSAWEKGNRTFLSFSRLIDTCDEDHDIPITDDTLNVIWAYSELDDEIQYHFNHRGAYPVYLLDPDLTPRAIEEGVMPKNVDVFNITRTFNTPDGQDTVYWCSFHKVPTSKKRHIIGFNTAFPTERDRGFVHHLLLHRCRAPPGANPTEFFEGATRSGGVECYVLNRPRILPVPYCRETIHVWGVGGNPIFFPKYAGMSMSADSNDEYFMLQVHYDISSNTSTKVTVSLEIYHTPKLRENEVGMLQLGTLQPGAVNVFIPPSTPSHFIYGHCAAGCTERILPQEGGNIFAVFLHTHISGRGVRALHFRSNSELPFILHDDNNNFDYQQFRILREERKVKRGDQIILRCNFGTTGRNGTVVHGGFTTRDEMCSSFMYYYGRNPGFTLCRSELKEKEYWDFLGIGNAIWNQSIRQMIITDPLKYRGLTVRDYAENYFNWTIESRETIQRLQTYLPQVSECPRFYYENASSQLQKQLNDGILERTGRLPGSDGRSYTSVDEDYIHISSLPRYLPRYAPEPQCRRRGILGKIGSKNDSN